MFTTRSPMRMVPLVIALEARHHAQGRRLAAAGRAEQRDDLAVLDLHRDALTARSAAPVVDLRDVVEMERCHGLSRSSRRRRCRRNARAPDRVDPGPVAARAAGPSARPAGSSRTLRAVAARSSITAVVQRRDRVQRHRQCRRSAPATPRMFRADAEHAPRPATASRSTGRRTVPPATASRSRRRRQRAHRQQIDRRVAEQPRDAGRGRRVVDRRRRRDLAEGAVDQHRDAVAERHRLLVVLRHVEDGRAEAPQQRGSSNRIS